MDKFNYIPSLALMPALVVMLLSSAASAGGVSNLSEREQIVEIQTTSGYSPVHIAPGRTWRIPGPAKIRYQGREVWLEHDMEWAIWEGGVFGPQRKLKRMRF
jgi:hypothetical protein